MGPTKGVMTVIEMYGMSVSRLLFSTFRPVVQQKQKQAGRQVSTGRCNQAGLEAPAGAVRSPPSTAQTTKQSVLDILLLPNDPYTDRWS